MQALLVAILPPIYSPYGAINWACGWHFCLSGPLRGPLPGVFWAFLAPRPFGP